MTQITFNAKISKIIKVSLYFANFEKKLNLKRTLKFALKIELIIENVKRLQSVKKHITNMQIKSIIY